MSRRYCAWRQTDERFNQEEAWPAELFPEADYRYFRDAGCLLCALAVMLRHYGLEAEEDESRFNPWILNERLIDCGAFYPTANLELAHISRLYPLEYLGSAPYSRADLVRTAELGVPCLVTVPGANAARHFTTLLSVTDDDALVYDPLRGERSLSSYERVLELRTFMG